MRRGRYLADYNSATLERCKLNGHLLQQLQLPLIGGHVLKTTDYSIIFYCYFAHLHHFGHVPEVECVVAA
jgi:hypothetical protein